MGPAQKLALGLAQNHAAPRSIADRIATRAFVWRAFVALAFMIALMRMIGAFPLPNDTTVVRLSLTDAASNATRIGQYASSQLPSLPSPDALLALDADAARASNAVVAVQPPTESAPPFHAQGMAPDAAQRAADCLAAAEWYEAGDNPPGERAVAQVVLNRSRHAAWSQARAIALAALAGAVDADVGLATHYHADYVVPRWRDSLVKLGIIGPHLFYRWPGYWGSLAALRPLPWGNDEPHVPSLAQLSPAHASAMPPALLEDDGVTLPHGAQMAVTSNIPSTMTAARSVGDLAPPPPRSGNPRTGTTTERIDIMVDPGAFSGSYAVRAFGLCKDHPRCLVIGRNPATPDAVAFLLLHDARKGVETALWNCAHTARPDTAQCLPDPAATARMVANWQAY